VVGDKLIYKGRSTSPNKFAKEVSGHVRNAWEDIMVRFPGENRPKMACVLRRQLQAETERQRGAGQSREAETLPATPEAPQPAMKVPPRPPANGPTLIAGPCEATPATYLSVKYQKGR
jgi:hypothetical protein